MRATLTTKLHRADIESDSSNFGEVLDSVVAQVVETRDIGEDLAPTNFHVHYYIHIPDGDESTYEPKDRNVRIDPQFQCQLQEEEQAWDISRFLALPKIIPIRQRKRQQLLLNFMKSKILTSHTYTEGCECVLAQKKGTQVEAR